MTSCLYVSQLKISKWSSTVTVLCIVLFIIWYNLSDVYGRLNYCKPCASIRYKSSRQTDEYREKAKEWSRKFRRENPDRVLEYDYYIASTMCNETNDLTKEDITPGMIKLQRKSLKLRREYYKLKNECNEW